MNHQRFGGREITVVVASETRKRPEDMRYRTRPSGPSHRDGHRSAYGRSRSRSRSRSLSPGYRPTSRTRQTSRSYTPPSRRQGDYSASPKRPDRTRSPRDYPEGRDEDQKQRSRSPMYSGAHNGHAKKKLYVDDDDDNERRLSYSRSPRRVSRSPSESRSRSADSGRSR